MTRFLIRCPECGKKTYQIDFVLEEGMCSSCLMHREKDFEEYEDRREGDENGVLYK